MAHSAVSQRISGEMTVGPPLYGTGVLTGTVTDTTINFVVPSDVVGTGVYTGTVNAEGVLSGTYTYPGQTGIWRATLAPPVNTAPPRVTGPTTAGVTLSCSTGSWTNAPTGYAYQWYRNGTPLAGFTTSTYTLGTLDEGTTLTCVVTASNAGGQASSTSNAVRIPIPIVPRCPAATGSMTGTTIGQIRLGMTESRARYLYRRHSNRGKQYEDFFCLTPIGVRVGYASPILLKMLPKRVRASLRGRVVWASTSNPYYSLDGVRPGESILTAARVLGTEPPFHIGLNYWYLARKAGYTAVLKVHGTVVQELGIADNALTKTRKTQNAHALVLLTSPFECRRSPQSALSRAIPPAGRQASCRLAYVPVPLLPEGRVWAVCAGWMLGCSCRSRFLV